MSKRDSKTGVMDDRRNREERELFDVTGGDTTTRGLGTRPESEGEVTVWFIGCPITSREEPVTRPWSLSGSVSPQEDFDKKKEERVIRRGGWCV